MDLPAVTPAVAVLSVEVMDTMLFALTEEAKASEA
jgi:hypothetical protein